MRITVFGSSGRVGGHTVRRAHSDGHIVTAFARDSSRLVVPPDIAVMRGDARDAVLVDGAIAGANAVIGAIGVADISAPFTTQSDAMRTIVGVMHRHGVRRIVAVAGAGILDHPAGGLRGERPAFPAMFRHVTDEHHRVWQILEDSGLDWTLACAPDILDGDGTGEWREAPDVMPEGGRRIEAGDVARFLLREIDEPRYVGRRVGICE